MGAALWVVGHVNLVDPATKAQKNFFAATDVAAKNGLLFIVARPMLV